MSHNSKARSFMLTLMAFMVAFTFAPDAQAQRKGKKVRGIQFGKAGQMTLAGSISMTSGESTVIIDDDEKDSSDRPTEITIAPRVGYFVWASPTLALELAGALQWQQSESDDLTQSMITFMVDPAIYMKSMKRRGIFPFAHVGVGIAQMDKDPDMGDSVSSSGTALRPGVGLNFCIGKKRGAFIRTELNYEITELLDDDDNGLKSSGPALRVSFGAFF